MKKVSGWILMFLGAFLLVTAILLVTIGPGLIKRTPLNVDTTTYLSGQAKKLDPATGAVNDVKVIALNLTQADPKRSDGDVVVFVSTSCLNINQGADADTCLKGTDDRVISNSIDTFAADRFSGIANNDKKYQNSDSSPHEGLVNKFPFDTTKKTYPYWDNTLKEAVDAKYVDAEKVQGLATYKFQVTVPTTKTDIAQGTPGTYANSVTIWVEPKTGAIVDQKQHQVLELPDGSPVLDLNLGFTDKTRDGFVSDSNANISKLNLITKLVPIIGAVLGVIGLIVGFLLIRGGRGQEDYDDRDEGEGQDNGEGQENGEGDETSETDDAEPSTA